MIVRIFFFIQNILIKPIIKLIDELDLLLVEIVFIT